MKVWITKHALTAGIEEDDVEDRGDGMVRSNDPAKQWSPYYHGEGRDWHRSRESAVTQANKMRTKKIASLRKQIAKLEASAFK